MASSQNPNPLYPNIIESNPEKPSMDKKPSSSSLYPTIDMKDFLPDTDSPRSYSPSAPPLESFEETVIKIPGAIAHLIDKQNSVELASGDLTIVRLHQGESVVAVLARIGDDIQWPLAKDEACVKLDESHYFFSLQVPYGDVGGESSDDEVAAAVVHGKNEEPELLNYGVTIAPKGQEGLLKELDEILEHYSSFSEKKITEHTHVLDTRATNETSAAELKSEKNMEVMEERSSAYWTTLAPNVEEYSGGVAKVIALGSGQLIKGILWCGDVTVERLKWGDEFLKKRMEPCKEEIEISPETLKRIRRAKRVTKMSEKMASGLLSGVLRVSGYFTNSIANSKMGKKILGMVPAEIVLASLDGFVKVCDAVEVAGKNVMSTSSVVTTELVSHRHGEKAAKAANEGLEAAGHAMGTAWAVFKIRKALNPKSVLKPTTVAKTAAKNASANLKSKEKKSKEKK